MIKAINISKAFNEKILFHNLTLELNPGKCLGIIGKNGAGKSTLINILLKRIVPDKGKVVWDFKNNKFYQKVGVQLQDAAFDPLLKVKEVIQEYVSLLHADSKYCSLYIKRLDISSLLCKRFKDLSYGEQQRVNILLSLLNNPQYLFFDEVTTGLDAFGRQSIFKILKDIKGPNRHITLVSHYPDEVFQICDEILFLSNGNVKYLGPIKNIAASYQEFNNVFNKWMED